MKINDVNLGEQIERIIKEKEISQAKLGKIIGLKSQNVRRDILAKRSLDTDIVRRISEFLDFNLFDLFTPHNQFDYANNSVKATVKVEMGEQLQEKTFTFSFGNNKLEIK